jgi:hypothetical protein
MKNNQQSTEISCRLRWALVIPELLLQGLFEKTKPIWRRNKMIYSLIIKEIMVIIRPAGHEKTKPIQSLS